MTNPAKLRARFKLFTEAAAVHQPSAEDTLCRQRFGGEPNLAKPQNACAPCVLLTSDGDYSLQGTAGLPCGGMLHGYIRHAYAHPSLFAHCTI